VHWVLKATLEARQQPHAVTNLVCSRTRMERPARAGDSPVDET
jgi:hypothetical protein